MSYSISKEFAFSASHTLRGLPDGHKCGRLHGHTYAVRIEVTGEVNEIGFVIDYGDLQPFGDAIDATLDHQHLNEALQANPTAENISRYLTETAYEVLDLPSAVASVRVWVSETPKTWAVWNG